MITAQDLYDRRDERGEISGTDLHEMFRKLLDGEPSPRGRTVIDPARIEKVAALYRDSPDAYTFLMSFIR
jgi:hypothetical protein